MGASHVAAAPSNFAGIPPETVHPRGDSHEVPLGRLAILPRPDLCSFHDLDRGEPPARLAVELSSELLLVGVADFEVSGVDILPPLFIRREPPRALAVVAATLHPCAIFRDDLSPKNVADLLQ